jgi:hypothetical protein
MKEHHAQLLTMHALSESHRPSIAEKQAEAALRLPKMNATTCSIAPLVLTIPLFSIARLGSNAALVDVTWHRKGRGFLRLCGRQLNQSHQTLLFALVKLRANQAVNNAIDATPTQILRLMRWSDSAKNIARLRRLLDDLKEAQVRIWADGEDQDRHSMRVSFVDSFKPADRRPWNIRLSEHLLPLFAGHLTYVNVERRKVAGREGLRTFLYGFICSESCQLPITYAAIHQASGSRANDMADFCKECRAALKHFKDAGLIEDFRLQRGGFRVQKKSS